MSSITYLLNSYMTYGLYSIVRTTVDAEYSSLKRIAVIEYLNTGNPCYCIRLCLVDSKTSACLSPSFSPLGQLAFSYSGDDMCFGCCSKLCLFDNVHSF